MQFNFTISQVLDADDAGVAVLYGKNMPHIGYNADTDKFGRPLTSYQAPETNQMKHMKIGQIIDKMGKASTKVSSYPHSHIQPKKNNSNKFRLKNCPRLSPHTLDSEHPPARGCTLFSTSREMFAAAS